MGLPESDSDSCYAQLEVLFGTMLSCNFSLEENVESCNRIGKATPGRNRTVFVVFKEMSTRDQIYSCRSKLREVNNTIFINEHLTHENNKQFVEVRTFAKSMGLKVWTYKQEIFVKCNNKKLKVTSSKELKELVSSLE